ncbi:MAG: PorT family protein [Bacteroidales bacterium]|nr:PorT family protein [Bacteroidales bacterium]
MKKMFIAAIAVALAFSANVSAQEYNNVRFGITGGLTSASGKIKDVDSKSISQYHAGVALEIPMGAGFAIQPEVLYQVKGMSLDKWADASGKDITGSFETNVGYVEVPVQIQWGPDLVAFRPYGFVEPYVGYKIHDKSEGFAKDLGSHLQTLEYGMSLGAGIDISHFQISAKYFWNFGNIYKGDISETGNTIKNLKDGNNFNGFAVSLAIFF